KKVLDLGCEAGYVSLMMKNKGAKVVSLDLCVPALQKFKEKLDKKDIQGIHPFAAIAQQLPLKPNQFDIVVATEVFEHMPELDKVIAEVARVMKSGGSFIVTFPNERLRKKIYWIAKLFGIHTEVEDQVTLYEYTKEEIIDRLAKHFVIKKVYSFPWYFRLTHFMLGEKGE
ncbi:MAG: class I SAM-dependent methyltransferase, partial [Candidatus Woesearchaeota archaeon]|nr:class I SAM-dependent methyltransferase [Candidatus Woesearchaeota archaeon]